MEVLACPHCDRLFQVTPVALGKKIRCRGCRGIFHVPHDITSVPLGPRESVSGPDESLPPLAIPCVVAGQDARSCPQCGRTFRMKDSFAGKTIRCRRCKVTFRVRARERVMNEPPRLESAPVHANGSPPPAPPRPAALPAPPRPLQPPDPSVAPPPQPVLPPTIFEDIGDLLDDLRPGEQVPSVMRPRLLPTPSAPANNPVVTMIAIVFGGVCALPATAWILATFVPERYREIVASAPEFIRLWLP